MSELSKVTTPEPGVYEDVPFADYRAWDAINYSSISKGRKSMRSMHHAMTQSSTASAAQGLGTAVHAALLEPDIFAEFPAYDGGSRKTKGFTAYQEAEGRECLTRGEKDQAATLAEIAMMDAEAKHLIRQSKHEICLVWEDPDYGKGKIRIDMLGNQFIADIKTARDISIAAMNQAFHGRFGWGYYLQFGWALEALTALGENPHAFEGYVIAVETGDIPDAYAARINKDLILRGQADARQIAIEYATCRALGNFYGVARDLIPEIEKPQWMKDEDGDDETDISTGTMEAGAIL